MYSTTADLVRVAQETLAITGNHDAAQETATGQCNTRKFMYSEIPRLPNGLGKVDPSGQSTIQVWREDTFNCAQQLLMRGIAASSKEIAVLSMASDYEPGGGFLKGARAQEEELARRSDLYIALTEKTSSPTNSFYPLEKDCLLYSENVTVFRMDAANRYEILREQDRFRVNIISAAALRQPPVHLDDDYQRCGYQNEIDREFMTEKVRVILRLAHLKGIRVLVLSAFGCGAFRNPAAAVALIFKVVLNEAEFKGVFAWIVFAIIDGPLTQNCAMFEKTFAQIM